MRISAQDARRLGVKLPAKQLTPAQRLLAKAARGRLEDRLDAQLKEAGYEENVHYVRQKQLIPGRKWAVDFYFPLFNTVVEVEGGVWMPKSAHAGGTAILRDIAKGNALTAGGYRVYRLTARDLKGRDGILLILTVCPLRP